MTRTKRKAQYFASVSKRARGGQLHAGMQGIMVTMGAIESRTIPRLIDLLDEFAEEDPAIVAEENAAEEDSTVEDELKKELAGLQALRRKPVQEAQIQPRFAAMDTGCRGILFISVRRADPLALAHRILTHVRTTGEQRARVAQRFLPVQQTCYASVPEILDATKRLLKDTPLAPGQAPAKFALDVSKARNNTTLDRDAVNRAVYEAITASGHSAARSAPLVVIVELLKTVACMSLLHDYDALARYNIYQLALAHRSAERRPAARDAAVGGAAADASSGSEWDCEDGAPADAPTTPESPPTCATEDAPDTAVGTTIGSGYHGSSDRATTLAAGVGEGADVGVGECTGSSRRSIVGCPTDAAEPASCLPGGVEPPPASEANANARHDKTALSGTS